MNVDLYEMRLILIKEFVSYSTLFLQYSSLWNVRPTWKAFVHLSEKALFECIDGAVAISCHRPLQSQIKMKFIFQHELLDLKPLSIS